MRRATGVSALTSADVGRALVARLKMTNIQPNGSGGPAQKLQSLPPFCCIFDAPLALSLNIKLSKVDMVPS
ncbi:MAG: hypothetical protein M3Q51_07315, partial [Pseudomonadota bacterium]|nr:hypothetical protein [Pseudomonadota bacterium]